MQHCEHAVVVAENAADRRGRENSERLQLAQQQQSQYLIQVGRSEQHSGNGRLPGASMWMQEWTGFNLGAQVRRGVQQKPRMAIGADGHFQLGTSFAGEISGSESGAVAAGTIPLRETAPS